MTQGAGQGPEVRTATLRDFRVPAYVYEGVRETGHGVEQAPEHSSEHPSGDLPEHLAGNVPEHPSGNLPEHPSGEPHGQRVPAQGSPHQGAPVQAPGGPVQGAPGPVPGAPVGGGEFPVPPGAPGQAPTGAAPVAPAPYAHQPAPLGEPHPGAPLGAHPGSAGEPPEGYTPTERDLPVISRRGDTVQVEVREMPEPPPAPGAEEHGPLYVVGDVHGYLDELIAALQAERLIDADLTWCAGNTRLWFLGDFTDRGPDGIGVIDLVMRLSAEAAAAGGYCKALMGNHELLLIGAKRFGDTPVNSGAGTATFQAAWLLNGGQKTDMERLEDHHLQWMARLDAIVEADGHLLVHSDTTAYLDYGDSIEAVNDTIHEALTRNDADEYWDLFRKFTKRFAFRDDSGPAAVRELLDVYGGSRIVHGHSPIPYLLGEVGSEYDADDGRPVIEGPHVYADGLAIAMDGGVTMAGKLLVCQLPLSN
ncbi:metallophosphoesterase [Streptomyces sp. G45]|uniref:metallophosphoesterase n=1 Tax=Streptomyces sp. G45 TaxID=3406627 RepID=UPI003C29A0EE